MYQKIRRFWHKLRHRVRVLRGHDRVKVWRNPPSNYLHSKLFPGATYSPWLADERFLHIYNKIEPYTLVDRYRCYELWCLVVSIGNVEGDIVEVGVWRGGTGAILATAAKQGGSIRTVYLADTFKGVVKAGEYDPRYTGGEHSDTSAAQVNAIMQKLGADNTRILEGVFPDETGAKVQGKIALLHCDVDVYESSRDVIEWVLPRLSVGGVIVFDDYGFSGCEGVTRYCNELQNRLSNFRFVYNLNGHALLIKCHTA